MTERGELLRRQARVRITNPANGSRWEGRVVSYADFPTIEIEQDDGLRIGLPQSFTVEEVKPPGCPQPMRVRIDACTACGCLVGKDDEDWAVHENWHRLLRNLTAGEPDGEDAP